MVIINIIHLNFSYKRLMGINKEKEFKEFYSNVLIIKLI